MYTKVRKRDGKLVAFDSEKIVNALNKAGQATGEYDIEAAKKLAEKVMKLAPERIRRKIPTVEEIQDVVEEVLLGSIYRATAKALIIYRD